MEAIGQRYESGTAVAERPERTATYQEQKAARDQRLKVAANDAVARHREAESERESAELRLGDAAAGFLLDEVTEDALAEAEREFEEAVRADRRWRAANAPKARRNAKRCAASSATSFAASGDCCSHPRLSQRLRRK